MIRGEYCPGEHRLFLEGHGEGGPYGHDLICAAATILARSFAALAEDAQAAGLCRVEEKRALANCVATILPCCVLSGGVYLLRTGLDWGMALPYLLGGLAGGFLGGKLFTKVPAVWLRRLFAAFLIYGGVRYLL